MFKKDDYKTSAIDRLSLIVERPENRLNQSTILVLERRGDEEYFQENELCKLLKEKLIPTQLRFRCRISDDMSTFQEMDSSWKVEDHVHIHTLEKTDEDEEYALMRWASSLQNLPLPRDKPLWDVHIIKNYSKGTAMMWRIHHTIGDGFSIVTLFASLSDSTREEVIRNLRENYFGPTTATSESTKVNSITLSIATFIISQVLFLGWIIASLFTVTWNYLRGFIIGEAKTVFKTHNLNEKKILCWLHSSQLISLSECSKIGKKHQATINDVMISCMLGAMSRYMDRYQFKEGEQKPRDILEVGISILANMRDPRVLLHDSSEAVDLIYKPGNKVGFMASYVPVYGIKDPVQRLKAVSKRLTRLKNSGERFISYYASGLVWMLPEWAIRHIWHFLLSSVTLVVSNVRGISNLTIGGRKIVSSMGFVPGTGSGEMAALVLSADGKLNMCLNCNSNAVTDPKYLMQCYFEEYKELVALSSKLT